MGFVVGVSEAGNSFQFVLIVIVYSGAITLEVVYFVYQ